MFTHFGITDRILVFVVHVPGHCLNFTLLLGQNEKELIKLRDSAAYKPIYVSYLQRTRFSHAEDQYKISIYIKHVKCILTFFCTV